MVATCPINLFVPIFPQINFRKIQKVSWSSYHHSLQSAKYSPFIEVPPVMGYSTTFKVPISICPRPIFHNNVGCINSIDLKLTPQIPLHLLDTFMTL